MGREASPLRVTPYPNMEHPNEWLERAFERHEDGFSLLKVDPSCRDPLRDEPRFQDLRNEELGWLEALEIELVAVLDEKGAG